MAKRKPKPSPWLKDIKWGQWLFFIVLGAIVSGLNAFAVKDATIMDILRSIAGGMGVAGAAFLINPRGLPWVERDEKAVPESAVVVGGDPKREDRTDV
jgi:uncharacterized membrane-anchored protein